jgi:hypothetical protein
VSNERKSLVWWWWLLPDTLIAAIIVVPMAPAIYALYLLHEQQVFSGLVILLSWLALYVPLIFYCDRRVGVRLYFSIPATFVILGFEIWLFWFV